MINNKKIIAFLFTSFGILFINSFLLHGIPQDEDNSKGLSQKKIFFSFADKKQILGSGVLLFADLETVNDIDSSVFKRKIEPYKKIKGSVLVVAPFCPTNVGQELYMIYRPAISINVEDKRKLFFLRDWLVKRSVECVENDYKLLVSVTIKIDKCEFTFGVNVDTQLESIFKGHLSDDKVEHIKLQLKKMLEHQHIDLLKNEFGIDIEEQEIVKAFIRELANAWVEFDCILRKNGEVCLNGLYNVLRNLLKKDGREERDRENMMICYGIVDSEEDWQDLLNVIKSKFIGEKYFESWRNYFLNPVWDKFNFLWENFLKRVGF